MRSLVLVGILACAVGTAACTQAAPATSPRVFNRPSRVTFVCFEGNTPVALESCEPGSTGATPTGFRLLALVPQQTRGEVAAVDLTASPPVVLDSDRRIPGYTFVPVGEVPTAIAVHPERPFCTFVANRASRDLTAIETVRFREESLGRDEPDATLELRDEAAMRSSGRPQAMEMIEHDGRTYLYVTLPEDAAIARVEVTNTADACAFGAIETIAIPTDVPAAPSGVPTDPTLLPADDQDAATLATCPAGSANATLAPVPAEVVLDPVPTDLPAPMPFELSVERDPLTDSAIALWIGDLERPILHRMVLGATPSFAGSLLAAGPIRDLAVTPPVPDTIGGTAMRRYLYAIDDRDGTVFVVDASTGHVLPVGAVSARRSDRLPLRATARAVEVIETDEEDFRTGEECGAEPLPSPTQLSGVFVSIAMSDATVRFVDVLDRDAICRDELTGDTTCLERLGVNAQLSYVRRHRPRIGNRVPNAVTLDEPPEANVGGATLRYGDDGMAMDPAAPTIEVVAAGCAVGLGRVFPSSGDPRICAVTDPWAAEPESWVITWQGALPGTASTGGNLELTGDLEIHTGLDLCARGVLAASAGTPAGEPEAGYAGDVVAITSALPEATAMDQACRAIVGLDVDDSPRPVLLPIRDIVAGEPGTVDGGLPEVRTVIRIDPTAPVLDRGLFGDRVLTARDVFGCFAPDPETEQLISFDVRTRQGYTVVGSRAGFQHRVIRSGTSCVVDLTQDRAKQGRAFLGVPYASERLATTLSYPPTMTARPEVAITFTVTDVPSPLALDLGSTGGATRALAIPSELVWSPLDQRLYAIDEVRRGLAQISVQPLSIVRFIE